MKRKLLLINPANQNAKGFVNDNNLRLMPLSLGIVAALTPDHWEIELLDENHEPFHFIDADLVGFTCFTSTAVRVYELAAIYRERGIKTVLGGVHATMCTDEALNYVDFVVIYDAERVWRKVISDFETGNLKKIYDGGHAEVSEIPHPRRDIYKKYPYRYDLVQTARGCPMTCDFCSVSQMCGTNYRERDVEDILDELEKTTNTFIFFTDDNLVINNKVSQQRAIRLFKGMVERGLNKRWLSQASINFADNDEVLYWAKKSGCKLVLIGIEAETPAALQEMGKTLNLKRGAHTYEHSIANLHRHGIIILATIIFAMEGDTKEALYARRDFLLKSSIDTYQCTILTPLPGTVVFARLKPRIVKNNFPDDWHYYGWSYALMNMPHLNHEEIQEEMKHLWLSLYNKEAIRRKMFRTLWNTRSLSAAFWAYTTNHTYGRFMLEKVIENDPDGVDYHMEWKNGKRSMYLKVTDKILWLFYKLGWHYRL